MNQAQLLAYIVREIKLDYIEQGLLPVSKIPWGDPNFKPKCWADDVWEWSKIGNIRQKQTNKPDNGATIPEVMKASIKNRLKEKNIDEVDVISNEFTEEVKKKKNAIRGIKCSVSSAIAVVQETQESILAGPASDEPETMDDSDNELDDSDDELDDERIAGTERLRLPSRAVAPNVENEIDVAMDVDINTNITIVENEETATDIIESSQVTEGAAIETESEGAAIETEPEGAIETEFEGAAIETELEGAAIETRSEEAAIESFETGSEEAAIATVANISAIAHKTRARKHLQDYHADWSKGRGKGGRKLRPTQGLLPKDGRRPPTNDPPKRGKIILEAKKLRRKDWSEWLQMYKTQTEAILLKAKKRELKCPECSEIVPKKSFLKHRTERGCTRLDLRIKMAHWSVENYMF